MNSTFSGSPAPETRTFSRWWPDGSYCPEGREHVAWTTITTTAERIDGFGTEGPVAWCGCGQSAWVGSA